MRLIRRRRAARAPRTGWRRSPARAERWAIAAAPSVACRVDDEPPSWLQHARHDLWRARATALTSSTSAAGQPSRAHASANADGWLITDSRLGSSRRASVAPMPCSIGSPLASTHTAAPCPLRRARRARRRAGPIGDGHGRSLRCVGRERARAGGRSRSPRPPRGSPRAPSRRARPAVGADPDETSGAALIAHPEALCGHALRRAPPRALVLGRRRAR